MAKSQNISKSNLLGKSVVDQEGNLVGTVKDVDFTIGKQGVSLLVENKNGGTQDITWDAVQGAADFVILKPAQVANAAPQMVQQTQTGQYVQTPQPAQAAQQTPLCPICHSPLTWIPQYKRWYCYKDQKYA